MDSQDDETPTVDMIPPTEPDPNEIIELIGPGGRVKVKRKHAGRYTGNGYTVLPADTKAGG